MVINNHFSFHGYVQYTIMERELHVSFHPAHGLDVCTHNMYHTCTHRYRIGVPKLNHGCFNLAHRFDVHPYVYNMCARSMCARSRFFMTVPWHFSAGTWMEGRLFFIHIYYKRFMARGGVQCVFVTYMHTYTCMNIRTYI